jgi:hypothetical protein
MAQITEGSINAIEACQVRCGHDFQEKDLRLTRRCVRIGESAARRRSRVGSSRPKWEIPGNRLTGLTHQNLAVTP